MDKYCKSSKLTAQGVSELPGPVGDSSSVPGSTRRSPNDWTNGEGKVDPRASPRSVNTTGDQETPAVVTEEMTCMKSTRRRLEFDEDNAGIIEDVEMPMQALKDKTPLTEKVTRIAKEKIFRGDKITRYMRKSPVEGSACMTTRSLARSQPGATRDEAASTSEPDTPAEMSDSGSEAAAPREWLRRKAMANRATAETEGNDEDSIVIKMSEWKAMTEIITEVFREIQHIGSRLYLMSKKDTDIKKRRDAISKKAIKLHSMLDEMRLKRNARTVTATRMTTPPGRTEEKEGKRKEISPVEGKGDTKRKRPTTVEASYAGACAGSSSVKATTDCTDSDVKENWIPVRGRRGKRTDTPTVVRKANAGRAALDKPKRPEGPKRIRNRPEAIPKSVVLYAAPVWAKTIKKKKNRNTLKRVQRSALMRSSTAYRTVFTGTLPIYYTIELRAEKYTLRYPFKRRSDLGLL